MTNSPSPTLARQAVRIACAAALCATAGCDRGPTEPPAPRDRVEGWRLDLQFLNTEVPRVHPPPPDDPAFAQFKVAVAALSDSVPTITDEAVAVGIQRLLAGVGDGHTSIIPDDVGAVTFEALMVDFYWFDDGVYVASVRPGLGGLFGARVTAVGGIPISEFLTRLAPFVPNDNAQSLRWLSAQLMQYAALVRATGAEWTDAGVPLDVVTAGGIERQFFVRSHVAAALPRLHPPGGLGPSTPRYLQHPEQAYWIDSLPADGTLYVNFNSVRDDASEALAAFAARLSTVLATGRFRNVVLDARLNNGGNNQLLPPLVQTLRTFNDASPANRLYVIIGRATFSAGQNFVNQIERTTRAVFVGEATGSRPNFIGDASDTPLPYSQIRVSIASKRYDDSAPSDLRPWIAPDIAVPVTSQDYFMNRDPAFDAAMAAIRTAASARGTQ